MVGIVDVRLVYLLFVVLKLLVLWVSVSDDSFAHVSLGNPEDCLFILRINIASHWIRVSHKHVIQF